MRVMAIGAHDFSFPDRVPRGTVDQRPYVFMATEANFGLGYSIADMVLLGMNFMT